MSAIKKVVKVTRKAENLYLAVYLNGEIALGVAGALFVDVKICLADQSPLHKSTLEP